MNSTAKNETREAACIEKWIFVGFSFLVILISLIGNSVLIIIVKRKIGGLRNTTNNYFAVNLSVADLVMSARWLIVLSLNLAWKVNIFETVPGVSGEVFCKVMHFAMSAMYLVSMFLILAISVDRACAILCPLKTIVTKRVARFAAALAWVVSCLFASNAFYFYQSVNNQGQQRCALRDSAETKTEFSLYYLFHTIVISVTFLTKVTLHTAIAIKLRLQKIPGNLNTTARQRRKKTNCKVLAMLIFLVMAFFTCHSPIWLYLMSYQFDFLKHLNVAMVNSKSYVLTAVFLSLSYGAINPYIMILFLPNFRRAVGILFKKMLPGARDSSCPRKGRVRTKESRQAVKTVLYV